MKVSIGSDHAGFQLKQTVANWLKSAGHQVIDRGTNSAESVDYPDYAELVANDVAQGKADRGILVCGSGVGVTIVANKISGIRAANCYNEEIAVASRAHNDANVLALGARFLNEDLSLKIVEAWLEAEFEGGRHQGRLDKIRQIEDNGASTKS